MDVRIFTLMKLGGELLLAEQLRDAARGSNVAGGEGGERRRVDVADLAARRDELSVLVDDEDDLGVRFPNQAVDDRLDLVELLFVHHHSGVNHREPPSISAERWQTRTSAARLARSRPQAKGPCQAKA